MRRQPTPRFFQSIKTGRPGQWIIGKLEPHIDRKDWRGSLARQTETLVWTVRGVLKEEITIRAAALTYHTLLSLIPLLAVGFALFEAFGGLEKLKEPLKMAIVSNLAVGRTEQVGAWIDEFIGNISSGAIAGVGVIVLFYTATGLLQNIEQAFNRIWGIEKQRPFVQRFLTYWGFLTLTPPLMGVAMALGVRMQRAPLIGALLSWSPSGGALILSMVSVVVTCSAFVFMYMLVPNTKVRFSAALAGGLLAGVVWNVTRAAFFWATAGSIKYSAIYGALGVLPLLMIWIYISWIIVLLGVTHTAANQTVHTGHYSVSDENESQSARERLAVALMALIAKRFVESGPPLGSDDLVESLKAPSASVRRTLDTLNGCGLIVEIDGGGGEARYVPGRSLHMLTLADVIGAMRNRGQIGQSDWDEGDSKKMVERFDSWERRAFEELSQTAFIECAEKKSTTLDKGGLRSSAAEST